MHYYKFNIKDWTRSTAHLSIEEEGVYRRLIDHYYESEMPIPKETKWVIRRLRLGSHEDALRIVLEEFFDLKDDGYHHDRCEKDLALYRAKADVNRENGKRGGRPKKPTENPEGFEKYPTDNLNHKPITKNQETQDSKALVTGTPETDGFELSSPEEESVPVGRKKLPFTYTDIQNAYNKICRGTFKGCDAMTAKRKAKVRAMVAMEFMGQKPFKDLGIGFWEQYFTDCLSNPHWCGNNDRGWRANFEFVTTPDNALKILEVE